MPLDGVSQQFDLRRQQRAGQFVGGLRPTVFSTAPSVQFHPHSQAATVTKNGAVVTACPDLQGLASLIGDSTAGPIEMTDRLGRKFWRFNGAQYATLQNTLTGLNNRGFTAFMVGRVHHQRSPCIMLAPRYAAYTSDAVNSAPSGVFGMLRTSAASTGTGAAAAFLCAATGLLPSDANAYKVITGTQMQVLGVASRITASGGTRVYINKDYSDLAQQTTAASGYVGLVIGGTGSASANSTAITTNVGNIFDLYEMAFWNASLANSVTDTFAAAMVANYAIPQLDSQLVLVGDSEFDGIATTLAVSPAWAGSLGAQLTEPGAGLLRGNVRLIHQGTSGGQTSNAVDYRDGANSTFGFLYPGGPSKNQIAAMYGRNDMGESGGKKNSATMYSNIVSLINTTSTGYLQRGWKVNWCANIAQSGTTVTTNVSPAGENTLQKRIEGLRALIAVEASHTPNSQFLTDCAANPGGTYDGLVNIIHLYDIQDDRAISSGMRWFYDVLAVTDQSDAAVPGPYNNDLTHPVVAGHLLMASGGLTPQYGVGAIYR